MTRATIERPLLRAVNAYDIWDIGFKAWKNCTIIDEFAICSIVGCWAVRCDVFWKEGIFRWMGCNWDWVVFPAILFVACLYWRFWIHRTLVRGYEFCVCPKVRPWLAMLVMMMALGSTAAAIAHFAVALVVVGVFVAVIL